MAWPRPDIESGLTSILNAATAIFGVLMPGLPILNGNPGRRD